MIIEKRLLFILLCSSFTFAQNTLSLSDEGAGVWNINYISDADTGCVLPSPFEQEQLNIKLEKMLTSSKKKKWRENGLRFAKTADIYSMPERAADIICSTRNRKRSH